MTEKTEVVALANEIEREMMAWREANEGIYTIRACAFAVAQKVAALNPPPPAGDTGEAALRAQLASAIKERDEARELFDTVATTNEMALDQRDKACGLLARCQTVLGNIARILDELDRQIVACDSYAEKSGRPMSDPRETWLICNSHIRDRARELRQALKEQTP